jgi:hypothetical protein
MEERVTIGDKTLFVHLLVISVFVENNGLFTYWAVFCDPEIRWK